MSHSREPLAWLTANHRSSTNAYPFGASDYRFKALLIIILGVFFVYPHFSRVYLRMTTAKH